MKNRNTSMCRTLSRMSRCGSTEIPKKLYNLRKKKYEQIYREVAGKHWKTMENPSIAIGTDHK
jgi:uncharacterized lipoprotein YmbA